MAFSPSSSSFSVLRLCLFTLVLFSLNTSALLLGLRHHHRSHHHRLSPPIKANQTRCNLFVGNWVYDKSYPIYQYSECPFIDPQFNCQLNGRPDSGYLKYRWKPATCELPRFNGLQFVERMRGRTVMFVGDSLGRNQWESLICMISSAFPRSSPTQIIKNDPLTTFRFLEYEVAISFYRAPYLVDVDIVQGKRVLNLDDISGNGNAWRGVDVLVFNTGHWWTHQGSLQGWDYMESEGKLYEDMDRLSALDHGLRTWARWVDSNIDSRRTRVFFQSISPTHYDPSEWSAGAVTSAKSCYGQTTPSSGISYPTAYEDQMSVLNTVLTEMSLSVYLLDITMLSAMRKDGHPSIYTHGQTPNPNPNPDCSHWCLPGLPDTWNQLFYTAFFYF